MRANLEGRGLHGGGGMVVMVMKGGGGFFASSVMFGLIFVCFACVRR